MCADEIKNIHRPLCMHVHIGICVVPCVPAEHAFDVYINKSELLV